MSVLKDVAIQISLHYSLENTDFRGATPADASPDMNLKRVFLVLAFSLLVHRPLDNMCGETAEEIWSIRRRR